MTPDDLDKLIRSLLYGKFKVPWDIISDHCQLDASGQVDVFWANSLDEEQQLRCDVAAFVKSKLTPFLSGPIEFSGGSSPGEFNGNPSSPSSDDPPHPPAPPAAPGR